MLIDAIDDTIAAISTAPGEGAVGIVRLSGPRALKVAGALFVGKSKKRVTGFKTYTLHYGRIVHSGQILDEVILAVMRSPHSYTREDVVEINCHGGVVALRKILNAALACGCRLASPGEFTRRAFLNGRIDLAQAEAVIDLIRAKTDSALDISLDQLRGGLSREINALRRGILKELSSLEAYIDFPEEDTGAGNRLRNTLKGLRKIADALKEILDYSSAGRILRDGLRVVICGRPNVGKSSLLNALIKSRRSIVTHIPGTTRDAIEETVDLNGVPVRLVDTAGILKPRNIIEREAVRRSNRHILEADLVLLVFDGSQKLLAEDEKLIRQTRGRPVVAVINKIDLPLRIDRSKIKTIFGSFIGVSAKTSKHLIQLKQAIGHAAFKDCRVAREHILVSNLRHIESLACARKLVLEAQDCLGKKMPEELAAQGLREAVVLLDGILGKSFTEDLLDRIFSQFCIGK
ncbi:MAG: tRNA uridine-5-carboxymethylaminomethyl(34) synthesis GTPase MnmE [Candidatus Omnitrophica bacterium]|nr:tRNA uridine-5-carboxymethylaminomethyl(34) synthesis GTPase MnmE [Candidatus Omnitrophota bacterium]